MDDEAEAIARPWLMEILDDLAGAAADISAALDRPPFISFFASPLAEGADQLGASVALNLGYRLQSILPLAPADYRTDFDAAGLAGFDALLDSAEVIVEVAPQNGNRADSYAAAGRTTIELSDILIALWDGEPARGVGGTAEVVSLALQEGIPVVHLTITPEEPGRILWTGYGPWADPTDTESAPSRPIDRESLRALIFALLDSEAAQVTPGR